MQPTLTKIIGIFIFLFVLNSCANRQLNISPEGEKLMQDQPPQDLKIKHKMYLVGSAGFTELGKTTPVLTYLEKQLEAEDENSTVVFLGDNIAKKGMPRKSKRSRKLAEHQLTNQLDAIENFKGKPIFLPGDHDWGYGLKGLARQEKFIEKRLNQDIEDEDDWENYFYPDGGCPGPEIIEINDQLVVIVVDSQWWVADWDDEPTIHDGCEVKNKFMMKFLFENAVRKYRNKNVVIAMHHPLYSNGPHGGNFTAKSHLFPLTDKYEKAYIPMPGAGSVYTFLRQIGINKKDITHPEWKTFEEVMMASAVKNGRFIFVSGHEHNLQYLERENQKFINSGSAVKRTASNTGKGGNFGYAKQGYSVLNFYENGETWMNFYVPNQKGTDAKLVFQQKIKEKLSIDKTNIPTDFPEFDSLKNEKSVALLPSRLPIQAAGGFHNFIFGKHYRDVYLQKYDFPILDLSQYRGGMTPIKRGGGNQTNSLRLKDADGHQWALRDLTKDATRFLPPPFNKLSFAKYIAVDNFLSTHPFAPLAIRPLADAANIYATDPRFFYVPKQPALGVYNDKYGASVYLLEERPGGSWEGTDVFDGVQKTYNTPEVSEKTMKGHKHQVDEAWALRSRLFDVIIGDWDRHDDQWRWGRYKAENGDWIYRPVPRDRDQAFSKYDGLITRIATIASPFTHQLAVYQPEIKSIKWSAWSPRNFDAQFLSELDWEDWQREANFLKENITDELIEEAFTAWPDFPLESDGEYIKSTLRKRRDNIVNYARRYFKFRAKKVDVIGTEDRELFEIERLEGNKTRVSMYELSKKGKKKDKYYERVFTGDVTKEIHVYGNGEDDEFRVSGEVDKGIKLRLIGGLGEDTFVDESRVGGLGKKTLFYDDKRKNQLTLGSEARDMRTNRAIYNIYDRRAYQYEYNYTIPIPLIGVNPDDGFGVGAMFINTSYNFKKEPFSSRHIYGARYAFATESFEANYFGDFLNTFGDLDLFLEGTFRTPSFAFNYFGFGNDSKANVDSTGIDFHRIRQGMIRVYPAFKKRLGNVDNFLTFGPVYERTEIDNTANRILAEGIEPENIFEQRNRIGAEIGLNFLNVDNHITPHRGMHFLANIKWMNSLDEEELTFTKIHAEASLYKNLDKKDNVVLAIRLGAGHIFGDRNEDYFFDDAPSIGGEGALRGYREQRFYGSTTFWQNTDLRLRLFSSPNRVIPFTMGLFGGFDYGRVWTDDDETESDDWHYSYGGGLWFTPLEAFSISLGAFVPKEDTEEQLRIVFRGGFAF